MIKKFIVFLVVLLVGLYSAGSVSAEQLEKHTFVLGTEISYIKYVEPSIMEETGMMYGIVGSYAYHNKLMAKVEGKGSWGQVDYDGKLLDGTKYTLDNINDYMLEFRGLVGYDIRISEWIFLTPYIGFGYRYLNDDASKDPAGYERESNYLYSPIGIEIINIF